MSFSHSAPFKEKLEWINELDYFTIEELHYSTKQRIEGTKSSILSIKILYTEECQKSLTLHFSNVTGLRIEDFGGGEDVLLGFRISDLLERGFEKQRRFLVEDYENSQIEFYCEDIEFK